MDVAGVLVLLLAAAAATPPARAAMVPSADREVRMAAEMLHAQSSVAVPVCADDTLIGPASAACAQRTHSRAAVPAASASHAAA